MHGGVTGGTPWRPACVERHSPGAAQRGELRCLVVEAVEQDGVRLIAMPWPEVDEHGCLVFADRGPALRSSLAHAELAAAGVTEPYAGQLFAAPVAAAEGVGPLVDGTAELLAFPRDAGRGEPAS